MYDQQPATMPAAAPDVRIAVRGLPERERHLLAGLVRLSERDTRHRALRLAVLPDLEAQQADVVLVDAADPASLVWARQQPWLADKAVIWIDAQHAPAGHIATRRPVQWPVLPLLLSRAMDNKPRMAAPPQAAPQVRNRRPRLLVVDDSTIARTQVRSLLSLQGCDAVEAENVSDGLAKLAAERFDAVLMDVVMPGEDGYDGCRKVKAQTRAAGGVPVVMLTSKSSPFDRIRGKMAGCDAYLAKPVDVQQLAQVLAQCVPGIEAPAPQPQSRPHEHRAFPVLARPAMAGAT